MPTATRWRRQPPRVGCAGASCPRSRRRLAQAPPRRGDVVPGGLAGSQAVASTCLSTCSESWGSGPVMLHIAIPTGCAVDRGMHGMPILDHFSPPLSVERVWNTFHHAWAATIARVLNRRLLPDGYFAAPNIQFGPRVEIDVGTCEPAAVPAGDVESVAVRHTTLPATAVIPAVFPDMVEVVIINQEGGPQVVAAIELVRPSNKDRPATRRAFVAKMSSYLQQGIALAVIDLVTSRAAHLHNEWIHWMQATTGSIEDTARTPLYANSYRPLQRGER